LGTVVLVLKISDAKNKTKENEDLAKGIIEAIDLDSYRLTKNYYR
jgi:hypothetical protein